MSGSSKQDQSDDPDWGVARGTAAGLAGGCPEEALARVRHLLTADHVCAVRMTDAHGFEVVAAAPAGYIGAGAALPLDASDLASVALAGHVASMELDCSEAPLEALAYHTGLEMATALPVRTPARAVSGAVLVAWSALRASLEAAEWAVDVERVGLLALLARG